MVLVEVMVVEDVGVLSVLVYAVELHLSGIVGEVVAVEDRTEVEVAALNLYL